MISFALLIRILWLFSIALETAILFVILRRKLLLTFPFFFAYASSMLSRDIVLIFIRYPSNLYARIYWYGEIVTVFLALAVIFETIRCIFPEYPFLRLGLNLAKMLGSVAALAAILMMVLAEAGPGSDHIFDLILLAERSVKFVQASWLILVMMLISYYGISWRRYSIGIVAGFGVHAALTLAFFELRTHANLVSNAFFVLCNLAAYDLSAVIWAVFFLRSWRTLPSPHLPETNLSEWNDAVSAYTQQWYRRY